jgi:hypothetical protein
MNSLSTFHRSVLPHVSPVGRKFFVTWRCKDALPAKTIQHLKLQYEREVRQIHQQQREGNTHREYLVRKARLRFFKGYEYQLHEEPYGKCSLRVPEVAQIIKDKLHQYDGTLYDLISFIIMPNHCHAAFDFGRQMVDESDFLLPEHMLSAKYTPLHEAMRLIKGGSSREINKILGTTGSSFWQKDSYDHFIRDQRSLGNVVNYTLNNAAAAGLVENRMDWPHLFHENYDLSG